MTDPTAAAPRRPLLPTPVALLWFAAVLVWAAGRLFGRFGGVQIDSPDDPRLPLLSLLWSLPTFVAVVLAAVGLALLWMRREPDSLSRVAALAATVMAVAGALSAIAVLALVAAGPDRPIGFIDLPVGSTVALATAAAGASTAVLIRPYVDVMAAHIWAGIGGAGIALPFMVAGVSPMFVMAAAMLLATLDRLHGLRVESDLAFRHALEAERIAQEGDAGRGIGVSGLPGRPPTPRAPRPMLPWSPDDRRATIWLGTAAIIIVALAWAVGAALGELGFVAAIGLVGPGYAAVAFGAVPLLWQAALLLRVASPIRYGLTVASGMLVAASLAVLTAPIAPVYLAAVILQSVTIGVGAGLLARRGSTLGRVMLGTTAALVWLLVIVPTGALPLAFIAVITTLIALRRKVRA
ncbi:MAG: hypothetical protein Q7J04_01130 [Microcella sp.]|nr:hypothetical protein [Microcella sp.]